MKGKEKQAREEDTGHIIGSRRGEVGYFSRLEAPSPSFFQLYNVSGPNNADGPAPTSSSSKCLHMPRHSASAFYF